MICKRVRYGGAQFRLQEQVRDTIRDLMAIDSLIPREASRIGCLFDSRKQREQMAIVEQRKKDLLGYIQTICRDNIVWLEDALKSLEAK
jgi:hypothetical protein